ncbi:hypothetical protein BSKO_01550 [Bryopsis sp. KO-2023]|nr:hypothetical protein BSKO_01550 [Bryopsis sp. KO-2023]
MSQPRVDLRGCLNESVHAIAPDLRGAVVYLDNGACEALGLTIGAKALFADFGASNVCDLGNASPQDAMMGMLGGGGYPPLVIFITQLLPMAKDSITKAMKIHPETPQVMVFCSYSVDAHPNPSGVIGTNAYMDFEKALGQQQDHKFPRGGNVGPSLEAPVQSGAAAVRVRYFPFPYSIITPWSFVLPSPGDSTSRWAAGDLGQGMGVEPVAPVEGSSDAAGASAPKSEVSLLSHAILGVACNLGVTLETFTLGPGAAQIGQEISKFGVPPALDGSTAEVSATLILVDRSMDMISPVMHSDNLVERMLTASSQIRDPSPTTSTSMDSTPCTSKYVSMNERSNRAHASASLKADQCSGVSLSSIGWFRPYDENWMRHFKELAGRRVKNGVVLVRKWLKEAMRRESVSQATRSKTGSPQTDELRSCIDALMQDSGVAFRQRIQIELGQTVVQSLDPEPSISQEVVSRNERQILMSPTPEELVQIVLDLLANTRKAQAVLSLMDVLGLLVFIYSLRGDEEGDAFTPAEEQFMMNAIIDGVIDDDNLEQHRWLGDLRHRIKQMQRSLRRHESNYETTALKLEFQDFLSGCFEKLRHISAARRGLRELRRLTGLNQDYIPLTRQIASLVYQDSKLEDLSRATSLLGGLLKMGLGRLGFQNKAKPGDHPVVILFVVGGISMMEVREVLAEIEDQSPWKPQVLLGGTCLLSDRDVARRVWG